MLKLLSQIDDSTKSLILYNIVLRQSCVMLLHRHHMIAVTTLKGENTPDISKLPSRQLILLFFNVIKEFSNKGSIILLCYTIHIL